MAVQQDHNDTAKVTKRNRLYFGAGPAKLPPTVLSTMQAEMFNIAHTNLSIFELSHRSKEYDVINKRAIDGICRLMSIDQSEYAVLLVPGGATLQFAAAPLNLVNRLDHPATMDYLITGHWSEKAAEEAELLGIPVRRIECLKTSVDSHGNQRVVVTVPAMSTLGDLVYYCQNETIDGVELPELVPARPGQHLLCDASSNILSRPINMHNYAVLFAGAQKNVGVAGVTIVIVKRSVGVDRPLRKPLPTMLDYHKHDTCQSIYNTPPMVAVYGTALVTEWLLARFGSLHALHQYNLEKASLLYNLVDADDTPCGLMCPVEPVSMRSRINVVLRAKRQYQQRVSDTRVIEEAREHGIEGIQGHRSVGGLRISLYNSITVEEVQELCDFLRSRTTV